MKQYLITLSLVFMSMSIVMYFVMAFIAGSFDPTKYDTIAKIFGVLVVFVVSGALTERIKEIERF